MSVPYIMTGNGDLTLFINGRPEVVGSDHINYKAIVESIDVSTEDEVMYLLDVSSQVETFSDGAIEVKNGELFYNGEVLHNALTTRILNNLKKGLGVENLVLFLKNLMDNPSHRAVNELYGFLEACSLPITSDGHFLAYKKVRHDYMDLHSGTFDNSIGREVSMARNRVDEDPNRTCSTGLHVCSFGYLAHYGGTGLGDVDDRVVVCKVNPRDVVAVPRDYDNQKMRVSSYTIVDEVPNDGLTRISDYFYGDREVGWVRSTLAKLKDMSVEYLKASVTFHQDLTEVSTSKKIVKLLRAVSVEFGVEDDDIVDSLYDVPGESITLQKIMTWLSDWT